MTQVVSSSGVRTRAGAVLLVVGIAAAILGAAAGVWALWFHLTTNPLADVRAYYDAGARLNAGEPLYVPVASTNIPGSYHYPPLVAILFRPLALLPYEIAAMIWAGVIVAATILTVTRLGIRRPVVLAIGWLALPLMWTVAIGQAQALVTLLLVVGSPWAVALAANLKVFPILVAIYWVGRHEWRRLGLFAGWMSGLLAFQFAVEPTATLSYLDFLRDENVSDVNNLSPFALSPLLWAVLVAVLGIVAFRLAPTRWGWAAAVALAVFATPRLLSYQLSTLLATLGGPDRADAAAVATDRSLPVARPLPTDP